MNQIIVENFDSHVEDGMAVYDSNGDKVGTVQQHDLTSGWLQTEKGVFFPKDRYIPFSAIDRIGPSGIYLSVTKDYVKEMYGQPPVVEVGVAADPAGAAAVGTVPSGYDGRRVVVDSSTISEALLRMENGLKVYDANGETVGRVYQYAAGSDWFVVEKGVFSPKDLYIPVTAVAYLDGDGVHLRVTKDVLKNAFVVRPTTVTAVVAEPVAAVVETVPSGDGSRRVVVDTDTISLAIDRLGRGPKVYDLEGKEIGRVYQYDPVGGWILVEKGFFVPNDLFIPVTAIAYLDDAGVHLRVTQSVLNDVFVVQPANVTFVAAAA
jgi:hypothetical protein